MKHEFNFDPLTAEELANAPQIEPEEVKEPIIPVPQSALPLRYRHPAFGKPVQIWPYHNCDGQLVGYKALFKDEDGGKRHYPLTYCKTGNEQKWRAEGFPAPYPLYNATELTTRRNAPVIVVRGEHNADAAQKLFPQFVATTSPFGDGLLGRADWSGLEGRDVLVSAHYDEREDSFATAIVTNAYGAGAASVRILRAETVGAYCWNKSTKLHRPEVPKGWDLAVAITDGWDPQALAEHIGSWTDIVVEPKPLLSERHGGRQFVMTGRGVETYIKGKDDDGESIMRLFLICGPLELIAEARTDGKDGWSKVFKLTNRDGMKIVVTIPSELLAGEGIELRKILYDKGLSVSTNSHARDFLMEYVASTEVQARICKVEKVGWHGNVFVTTNGVIGQSDAGEEIHFDGMLLSKVGKTAGTLESWQKEIALPAVGNSRLVFVLSLAFAAPLLKLTKTESGIFHLVGQSSKGKTTALTVSGSVWGGGDSEANIKSWRATANGLEGIAAGHNDVLLCLDEMSQIKGSEAGAAAYMLANGIGKQRAGKTGEPRPPKTWRTLVLSSGEVDLNTKIKEDDPQRQVAAGQLIRVVDIGADAESNLGIFEKLNGFRTAEEMAVSLNRSALENYGHSGTAFVEMLSRDIEGSATHAIALMGNCLPKLNVPAKADSQVVRVAKRFALVAAAGEMATTMGILPWTEGEATNAAKILFHNWLDRRGGTGALEADSALAQVRYFLFTNGYNFFEVDNEMVKPIDLERKGFKRVFGSFGSCYCFPPEVWKRNVCAGLDPSFVAKTLAIMGYMVTDSGRNDKTVRTSFGTMKVYAVKETVMMDIELEVVTHNTLFPEKIH